MEQMLLERTVCAGHVGTVPKHGHTGVDHSKLLLYNVTFKMSPNPQGKHQMPVDTFGAADNCFLEFLLGF